MRALLTVFFLLGLAAAPLGAVQARFARHPAPSPDGQRIVFSWQGDLWSVSSRGGIARRLTAHPAADRHPVWSRDGRWIAFASDRHGNDDVHVMPADASEPPRRLTHASVTDLPVDFTADGTQVLFVSYRDETMRKQPALYAVSLEGGTPALAQSALARFASESPDGTRRAFSRGRTRWWRHGYRGSGNRELWLRHEDGSYEQLTTFEGDDDRPTWIDPETLLFLSERSGRKGLWVMHLPTGELRELHEDPRWDVRFPRASADGSVIAYESADELRVLRETQRSGGGRLLADEALEIEVAADVVRNRSERRADTSDASELAVSPDGTLAAFVVHGDVFVTEIVGEDDLEVAEPPTAQITATPGREKDLSWSPDGEALLFASDREGSFDLWLARPSDEETGWARSFAFELERLTDEASPEHSGRFSPDGTWIAFLRGKGDLTLVDRRGRRERLLHPHWNTQEFVWSPDGRWIATSYPDLDYNREIWILPFEGGEPYNVSRHPDSDHSPHWTPDGRRLLWLSRRHGDTYDVWGAWLAREDAERRPAEWLRLWNREGDSKDGKSDEKERAEKKTTPVTIDFEDLWRRSEPLTALLGDEGEPFAGTEGRRIYFTAERGGERDLYSVRWDGEQEERLTEGGASPRSPRLSKDGKTIFYLTDKGKIARVSAEGKKGPAVPFTARYVVDHAAERVAVFEEAWQALEEWFYDPGFHGVDWKATREKYRPLVEAASHPEDFEDAMDMMLGEVNASHMGYSNPRSGGGESTGWIGALFDPGSGGPGLRIREVLPGGPADRLDVGLRPGDRLLAVDGVAVEEHTNVFSLLAGTEGRRIPLRILPERGAERTVTLVPVDFREQRRLRYEQWTDRARGLVEEWSGGRLGYLHIQGMNIPSFEEFERDLYAAGHGKEGLLIDVRSNGGGWTTDYLLAVLEVERHARTVPRDAPPDAAAYPQSRLPLAAWTRPAMALCNEESFSNAEIFSHAFKSLDRGLLVGVPTFGGVISTGGRRLLNGGWVRLPLRGWYVAGSGVNMENNGAVPDLVVPQPLGEETSSEADTQLREAVRVFLERLEEDPRYGSW